MNLKPCFVKALDGKVYIQVGENDCIVREQLPDRLSFLKEDGLEAYFKSVVPDMVKKVHELRRKKLKLVDKKAKNETDS